MVSRNYYLITTSCMLCIYYISWKFTAANEASTWDARRGKSWMKYFNYLTKFWHWMNTFMILVKLILHNSKCILIFMWDGYAWKLTLSMCSWLNILLSWGNGNMGRIFWLTTLRDIDKHLFCRKTMSLEPLDVEKYRFRKGSQITKPYVVLSDKKSKQACTVRKTWIEDSFFRYPPDTLFKTWTKLDSILMDTIDPPDDWEEFEIPKIYFQAGNTYSWWKSNPKRFPIMYCNRRLLVGRLATARRLQTYVDKSPITDSESEATVNLKQWVFFQTVMITYMVLLFHLWKINFKRTEKVQPSGNLR